MKILDTYINYGERKLGESFPDAASLPPQIDNMDPVVEPLLSREQSAFLVRTALEMGKSAVANVMHPVKTVRSAFEAAAGRPYPDMATMDSYGDDIAAEQSRISARLKFIIDAIRFRRAAQQAERSTGNTFPTSAKIRSDVAINTEAMKQ
jgi:hypothetical protein